MIARTMRRQAIKPRGNLKHDTCKLFPAAELAISDFRKASQIVPSPLALYCQGRALESKGENQEAVGTYAVALQLAPAMAERG
jgi:hypothetical protein